MLTPLVVHIHPHSDLQAAAWAPDGSGRLLSISFDDTLRVWGPTPAGAGPGEAAGWGEQLVMRHNNNTGRWVVPFRVAWGPGAEFFVTGGHRCSTAGTTLAAYMLTS